MTVQYKHIGTRRPLIEGREKVTGRTRFVADLQLPGTVYGRPILSPYAHAKITEIDKSEAEALPGVIAVLTAADLPTRDKVIRSRMTATLAKEAVHFVGQPVVLVVAENMMIAEDAVDLVYIDYEPLPAVTNLLTAIEHSSPAVWPNGIPKDESDMGSIHGGGGDDDEATKPTPKYNNIHAENHFERGDITAGFAAADVIIEREYTCNIVHQGYIEPHAAVTVPSPLDDSIDVYAAVQGKFWLRDDLAKLLDLPLHKVRVHSVDVGGGFGAKYGILDGLGASAAVALGRPVKIILSRSDDFLTTMPAPAIHLRVKTGAKQDGTITAIQMEAFCDNGVYFGWAQGWLIGFACGGYYKCDNLQIDVWEVLTHKPPIGAYRAPAMPQGTFALESNIDDMAAALGIAPFDFRRQNAAEPGDPAGNGKPWRTIGFKQCLDALADHPLIANPNLQANEGVGIAIAGWGTNVGPADATCRVDTDGSVVLQTGQVDLTSNSSAFVLIVAESMGVSPSDVVVVNTDTTGAFAPGSGGSQVTYSVAGAVRDAADSAAQQVREIAADMLEAAAADIELIDGRVQVRGVPDKALSLAQVAQNARSKRGGQGPIVGDGKSALPEPSPAASVHLVKVHVDPVSGKVTPRHYVCAQDVGKAINPLLVEGQMHGGMAQGLGFALHEAMIYDENGQLLTGSFLDYDLPQSDQVPTLEAIMVENPSPISPFGMRGVGEPPIIGGAAAVANAIRQAVGVRPTELPIRAEHVWQARL